MKNEELRMKTYLIILFGLIYLSEGQAQRSWRIEGKSLLELKREDTQLLPLPDLFMSYDTYLSPFIRLSARRESTMLLSASPLPSAYHYKDLAFFCRIEVQMEQAFKFPVKFRLGEVQYVERMEGKY
jgi:hypothetical protein